MFNVFCDNEITLCVSLNGRIRTTLDARRSHIHFSMFIYSCWRLLLLQFFFIHSQKHKHHSSTESIRPSIHPFTYSSAFFRFFCTAGRILCSHFHFIFICSVVHFISAAIKAISKRVMTLKLRLTTNPALNEKCTAYAAMQLIAHRRHGAHVCVLFVLCFLFVFEQW